MLYDANNRGKPQAANSIQGARMLWWLLVVFSKNDMPDLSPLGGGGLIERIHANRLHGPMYRLSAFFAHSSGRTIRIPLHDRIGDLCHKGAHWPRTHQLDVECDHGASRPRSPTRSAHTANCPQHLDRRITTGEAWF